MDEINIKDIKLLVIVITFNGDKWIEKCINSILNSIVNSKIFIVDNGSTDETINLIENHPSFNQFIFIKSKENLGFGKANNLGFKYAIENNFDYIYLLNQDAWVYPDTYKKLIEIHRLKNKAGILSPLQISSTLNSFDTGFSYYCPAEMVSDFFFHHIKLEYKCEFVNAAHWLISRECLEIVGGFNPNFQMYGEDNNYCERAINKGFDILIVTNTMGVHDRKFRKENDEKKIYFRYIKGMRILNSPIIKKKFLNLSLFYFEVFLRYKNKKDFKNFVFLISNYFKIKKIFLQSLQQMAFLK